MTEGGVGSSKVSHSPRRGTFFFSKSSMSAWTRFLSTHLALVWVEISVVGARQHVTSSETEKSAAFALATVVQRRTNVSCTYPRWDSNGSNIMRVGYIAIARAGSTSLFKGIRKLKHGATPPSSLPVPHDHNCRLRDLERRGVTHVMVFLRPPCTPLYTPCTHPAPPCTQSILYQSCTNPVPRYPSATRRSASFRA